MKQYKGHTIIKQSEARLVPPKRLLSTGTPYRSGPVTNHTDQEVDA